MTSDHTNFTHQCIMNYSLAVPKEFTPLPYFPHFWNNYTNERCILFKDVTI